MKSANRIYPDGYRLPKKNALLISCIDLRLMDDLVHFMDHDNMTNRYDHFVLAGAALCCVVNDLKPAYQPSQLKAFNNFDHWKDGLYDHIKLAIMLHEIEDIYIVEHMECGAYKNFLIKGTFDSEQQEQDSHKKFALQLSKNIKGHKDPEIKKLHVHTFMMNTRGDVSLMSTTNPRVKTSPATKPLPTVKIPPITKLPAAKTSRKVK